MIIGIGMDVVDIERFRLQLQRTPGLVTRLFVPAERELTIRSLAARFAAKEAVAKALGAPVGMNWQDCCIAVDAAGVPSVEVCRTVAAAAARLGITEWHLSLSHDGGLATAMVVAEGTPVSQATAENSNPADDRAGGR
ncbi:holo-ACP synthase [Arthrobacter sp. Br18]|uniref:holo-ACP synthase n=1 Tax=Arthrobacter sp. Br18 TaxID=1312954 RepID=UPI0004B2C8AA|nr:holo-ACP synthase [Arthrobacter sp. Br18]